MSKQGRVSEVPGAQTNVSHCVGVPGNAVMLGEATTLVVTLDAKWASGHFQCRGEAFAHPADVCGVVGFCPDRSFTNIHCVGHDHMVRHITTQLKLAVV